MPTGSVTRPFFQGNKNGQEAKPNGLSLVNAVSTTKLQVMKKFAFGLCFIALALGARAQSFEMGIKAGLNQGSLTSNPSNGSAKSTTGFVGGTYARVKVLGLFVQPELLFSQRRGSFTDQATKETTTHTLSYIDLPVLAGYKILVFRINAGPNLQFLVGANQTSSGSYRDPDFSKSSFNSVAVGFQAGIGADLGFFRIDARYDGSFGSLGKKVVDASGQTVDYSTRSNMYQITLGYRLFGL